MTEMILSKSGQGGITPYIKFEDGRCLTTCSPIPAMVLGQIYRGRENQLCPVGDFKRDIQDHAPKGQGHSTKFRLGILGDVAGLVVVVYRNNSYSGEPEGTVRSSPIPWGDVFSEDSYYGVI